MESRTVTDFYNNLADHYDREQDLFKFVREPERELIFRAFAEILNNRQDVLEIGAGTGRFTIPASRTVKKIHALDISKNMLDKLKEKKEKNFLKNIEIIQEGFLEHDFNQKFDLIMSFSALEYIKDSDQLFKKMSGLLKDNGQLIFTTAHNTFFRLFGRIGNYFRQKIWMNAFSKRKIGKILAKNQLEIVEIRDLVMKTKLTKGILLFVHAKKKSN